MGCGPGHVPKYSGDEYAGLTTAELYAALKPIDHAIINRAPGVGAITSASVNGKSFTYSTSTAASDPLSALRAAKTKILDWINWCENGVPPPQRNRAIGVMRWPSGGSEYPCY
jgi:hypothetical protein